MSDCRNGCSLRTVSCNVRLHEVNPTTVASSQGVLQVQGEQLPELTNQLDLVADHAEVVDVHFLESVSELQFLLEDRLFVLGQNHHRLDDAQVSRLFEQPRDPRLRDPHPLGDRALPEPAGVIQPRHRGDHPGRTGIWRSS